MPQRKIKSKPKAKPRQRKSVVFKQPRDARTTAPAARSTIYATKKPVVTTKLNAVNIRHKELFGGVWGSVNFAVSTYNINPGNSALFPWLSQQASGWERYRFKRLVIRYVPRCSTATSGSVLISPDYDAADPVPTTEVQAASYADAKEGAPWQDITIVMSESSLAGGVSNKYVKVGALGSNLDVKTYDAGRLSIVTIDCASNGAPLGKLWVEYEIEFYTPHTIPIPWASCLADVAPAAYATTTGLFTPSDIRNSGPIAITLPVTTAVGARTNTVYLDYLVPGASYLVTLLVDAVSGTVNSTVFSALGGLTESFQMIKNVGWAGVGKQTLIQSIMTAVASNGNLSAVLTGVNTINGASISVVPMLYDALNSAWYSY